MNTCIWVAKILKKFKNLQSFSIYFQRKRLFIDIDLLPLLTKTDTDDKKTHTSAALRLHVSNAFCTRRQAFLSRVPY